MATQTQRSPCGRADPGSDRPAGHRQSRRCQTSRPGSLVSELRIDYGPGYRVYFLRDGARLILLLNGGDKSTQDADIKAAYDIARHWRRTQGGQQ